LGYSISTASAGLQPLSRYSSSFTQAIRPVVSTSGLFYKKHKQEIMEAGKQIIGFDESGSGNETFYSYNPIKKANNDDVFFKATQDEINEAVDKAAAAFQEYRTKSGKEKADFLESIAEEIMNTGVSLVEIASNETGLPSARIEGDRLRTVNQLRMFAGLLREGSWVDARIETAIPERTPMPKPDLRYMQKPIGPVVVFGASNFPLSFSVAGGDTASALAAGCPVIVKAHPAHPATSRIIGKAVQTAARNTNMPDGVFSLLFDNGIEAGIQLVKHPSVRAVGFTGSYQAGKALYDAAVSRPEPIPVYAEMSSTNPVFVLPQALKQRGQEIAKAYSASVTLGVGQFCTNPGMLVYQDLNENFRQSLTTAFEKTSGGIMLTPSMLQSYTSLLQKQQAIDGVQRLAVSSTTSENMDNHAVPVLLTTGGEIFNSNRTLSEEVFGPSSIVVTVTDKEEMLDLAKRLSGHLTVTVHGTDEELSENKDLLNILEQKAGRVVINGFPTGVEVCSAMVHGGPFPATTDSRSTSVGTAAIYRFTRPVCYQNMPQPLLPTELQNKNVGSISRLVNGERTVEHIQ
jgi:2,5-dioxopentanoate dehydrogenase